MSQGKYEEALPLLVRSQAIREKVLGPDDLEVAEVLDNRAKLLESQARVETQNPVDGTCVVCVCRGPQQCSPSL